MNAMLQDAERFGVELRFVSRAQYRRRNEPDFPASVGKGMSDSLVVLKGDANNLGAKGARFLGKLTGETSPNSIRGALASSLSPSIKPIGVAILKLEKIISSAIAHWVAGGAMAQEPMLIADRHHGGYGKSSESLIAFQKAIKAIEEQSNIGLGHVYTAKLAYPLRKRNRLDEKIKGKVRKTSILFVHTGLQGRSEMNNI